MPIRLNSQDLNLLASIAEYRILTVHQLSVLHQRNQQSLRRRLHSLEKQGLVQCDTGGFGRSRGRPKRLVFLLEGGVNLLQEKKILDRDTPPDAATAKGIHCLDHHLLVNAFRVQLIQMQRIIPVLKVKFLSPTSPFLKKLQNDQPLVFEKIPPDEHLDSWVEFIPDGVFAIKDTESNKVLLFFLEVDMGTETIASPRRIRQDVRQKIVNYQTLLRRRRYKRYEKIWGCRFRGFRLLFLAFSPDRMGAISRLAQSMPPSGFIWVTDRGSLESRGVGDDIWAVGGQLEQPMESILGSRKSEQSPKTGF